jgi:hypothetical protein
MKRLVLGLFLGLLVAGIFGCASPAPQAPQAREEVIGTSDRVEKTEWEPVMPGK